MIPNSEYDVINKVPMTKFKGLKNSTLYFINTMTEWKAFFELLMERKIVACDTETSGFDYYLNDRIVGMSFGWLNQHFYIPVRHMDSELGGKQPPQLSMDDIRDDLRKFFSRTDVTILLHNWKFDSQFFRADGIELSAPFHDTRILWHLYDENAPGALKTIASGWTDIMGNKHGGLVGLTANAKEKELDVWRDKEAKKRREIYRKLVMARADELKSEIEHQDKNRAALKRWIIENELHDHPYRTASKEDVHYGYVPADLMTEYAATDTFLTYTLYEYVMKNLSMTDRMRSLYLNEIKLSRVLMETEWIGAKIDRPYLIQLGHDYDKEIVLLEAQIKDVLGDINLNSTSQLADSLILQGVPLTQKTTKGHWALDSTILKKHKNDFDIIQNILKLRNIVKLKGTYVDGILSKLTDDDILHCSFNQNVSTGRMSSRNPNLQNIPAKDDSIRKAFISHSDDYIYVLADYSQMEVRLTAHYSEDPLLLDAYNKGQDVHTRTMCEMFGYDYNYASSILDSKDPKSDIFKTLTNSRKISKCVHPSTILMTDKGPTTIGSLEMADSESAFLPLKNTVNVAGSNGFTKVKSTYSGNVQDLLHIITNRGIVTCTPHHRFSSEGTLVRADELKKGIVVDVAKFDPIINTTIHPIKYKASADTPEVMIIPTKQLAYVAGMFTGDGSVSGQFFDALGLIDQDRSYDSNSQKKWFIPDWVWANTEFLKAYLGGLFDTDGSVSKNGMLSVTTKSVWLASHVCAALNALGLHFTLEVTYNKKYKKDYYRVRLGVHEGGYFSKEMKHTGKLSRLRPFAPNKWKKQKEDKVLSIKSAGVQQCVDIEVDSEDHLYSANGLITHNTINFGIIYGVGAPGLSTQIPRPDHYKDLEEDEWIKVCQNYIDQYFDKYLGVKRFISRSGRDLVKQGGVLYNHFGRPRRLPHALIKDRQKFWMVGRAKRQGTNFLVQSTAADVFKIAVVRVYDLLKDTKSFMINFVHDEIQAYIHKDELYLLNLMKVAMEDFDFIVPLLADFSWTKTNWADKKPIG